MYISMRVSYCKQEQKEMRVEEKELREEQKKEEEGEEEDMRGRKEGKEQLFEGASSSACRIWRVSWSTAVYGV